MAHELDLSVLTEKGRIMTMTKIIMGAVIAMSLAAVPLAIPTAVAAPNAAAQAQTTTVVAKVNGLVCDFCAQALKKVFGKEDAVSSIDVDLDAAEVRVFLKSGYDMSDERIENLIRNSGYSVVSIGRPSGT
jgi:copper chaperone CopZ